MQGRGKFNVCDEIISLQFTVNDTQASHHICKQCLRKLQKRYGLRTNLRELDEEIFQSYSSKAYKAGLSIKKKAVLVHDLTAEGRSTSACTRIRIMTFFRFSKDRLELSPLIFSLTCVSL